MLVGQTMMCAISDTGEVIAAPTLWHTRPGSEELAGWLAEHMVQDEFDRLQIAGEYRAALVSPILASATYSRIDDLDVNCIGQCPRGGQVQPVCVNRENGCQDAYAIAEWLAFVSVPITRCTWMNVFFPYSADTASLSPDA
jgi:hypothetical protein